MVRMHDVVTLDYVNGAVLPSADGNDSVQHVEQYEKAMNRKDATITSRNLQEKYLVIDRTEFRNALNGKKSYTLSALDAYAIESGFARRRKLPYVLRRAVFIQDGRLDGATEAGWQVSGLATPKPNTLKVAK